MQDVCVHLSYQGDLPQFISGNEKYHYKKSRGPHQIHTLKTPNTHTKMLNTLSDKPSNTKSRPPNEQEDSRSVRY